MARHRQTSKLGKDDSPRTIFPEWMGEELPSVRKAMDRGDVYWDEAAGRVRQRRLDDGSLPGFDYGRMYDEIDDISAAHLGDDFVSVIDRDPIKVAVSYLEKQRRDLRYWTALKTMTDHGIGYWASSRRWTGLASQMGCCVR